MTQAELSYAAVYADASVRDDMTTDALRPQAFGLSDDEAMAVEESVEDGDVDWSQLPAQLRPDTSSQ